MYYIKCNISMFTLRILSINHSNDYFDADTGVDTTHKPESVVNLLGGKK